MFLIAGHKVVGAGGIGTFQEDIVVGVFGDFDTTARVYRIALVLQELQQLLPQTLANPQFRPGQNIRVFFKDGPRHVQPRRFGNGKQKNSALQPSRVNGSRNQHIGVDYQADRKHYRFDRAVLMIRSI